MNTHHRTRRLTRAAIAFAATAAVATAGTVLPLAAEAAPARTRPAAPAGLTVDDVARPLNTDDSPRFGWLPRDADANEVQTAYKIEVRDTNGAIVWDSDRVPSSQQSYVEYDGAPLDPGSVYTWRVRTWDKNLLPSPWSNQATSRPASTTATGAAPRGSSGHPGTRMRSHSASSKAAVG